MSNYDSVEDIFVIKSSEVQLLAQKKFGRYLDETELREVQKRMQFGQECWEEVVLYAMEDVIAKSENNCF
jgi:hypothetical protein